MVVLRTVQIERLLVELAGHRAQDDSHPFVNLAVGEMAAMLGVLPKLQWSAIHRSKTHLC